MYNFEAVLEQEVCSTAWALSDVLGRQEKLKFLLLTFLHEIINNMAIFQISSLLVMIIDDRQIPNMSPWAK